MSNMKVDLDGRVKNLDLPVSKPLLPLLEAILTLKQIAASGFACFSTYAQLTPSATSGRGTATRALPVSADP